MLEAHGKGQEFVDDFMNFRKAMKGAVENVTKFKLPGKVKETPANYDSV